MKLAIMTALIVVAVCLLFPRAGSTQDKGADRIQGKAEDNDTHSKPLAPPVVQPEASPNKQNPGASIEGQDVEHRVRIGAPVTVDSVKNRWDKALVVLTGLIVIVGLCVGFFQIIFQWKTVKATSDNAKAAKASADALINSERAWLLVETAEVKSKVRGHSEIYPVIKNFGKTIARIHKVSLGGTKPFQSTQELPDLPVYERHEEYDIILCPNREFRPFYIPMNDENLDSIQSGLLKSYIFGCIEYTDLGGVRRTTTFCLVYDRAGNPAGFYPYLSALPAYNKAT